MSACYYCGEQRTCKRCQVRDAAFAEFAAICDGDAEREHEALQELGRLKDGDVERLPDGSTRLSRAPGWASRHWPDCKDWDLCVMHNWECGKRRRVDQ